MTRKKRISTKDLRVVRQLDLLTYFQNYEAEELIKNGRNDYKIKSHSSLHLSNGMWCYWAKNIGGVSALDYFIKVEGWGFLDAALYLQQLIKNKTPIQSKQTIKISAPFRLPNRNENENELIKYLTKERCIDKKIVDYCINNHLVYETQKDHSVIFIGYDEHHFPRHATKRSTTSNFKMDLAGSHKENSFNIVKDSSSILHVFESAIDLLSYLTLLKRQGRDYLNDNYLSLSGATLIGQSIEESSIPVALEYFLNHHPNIKTIHLYLDNDKAGKDTTLKIIYHLKDRYTVFDNTPQTVKDMNELLIKRVRTRKYLHER